MKESPQLNTAKKIRVLNVGSGPAQFQANDLGWITDMLQTDGSEVELFGVDANPDNKPDLVHDITTPFPKEFEESFDIVYASHVLEHIPYGSVAMTLAFLEKTLRPGGEMWIIVPSLEFACKEVVLGREDWWLMSFLYGAQTTPWEFHNAAFSIQALRGLLGQVGLSTRRAYQSDFGIARWENGEMKEHVVVKQNVVIGYKDEL